jgi:hypothetical protein
MDVHYKEKRFVDGVKVYKEKDMFSRQTNRFIPSVYAGINFRSDLAVTFKLYLDDLMNRSYTEPVSGIRPYQNMESQLFYISLSKKFKYSRIKEIASPDQSRFRRVTVIQNGMLWCRSDSLEKQGLY